MAMLIRHPLSGCSTPPGYFPIDVDANLPATASLVPTCRNKPLRLAVRGSILQDDCSHFSKKQKTSSKIDQQHDLLAAKKLSLVLDLDHTLLHTVKFSKLRPSQQAHMRKEQERDIVRPQRHLFCLPHLRRWTRLRPGIWTFLEKASQLYELHICTMGSQLYAHEMAKLLDPTGALFRGRVVSKRVAKPMIKDLDDVLGTESTAVIIDDNVDVWPRNKANLIHANDYSVSFSHEEEEEDRTLTSLYTVIERIYHEFFSNPILWEMDVRNIIAAEHGKVLAGCCLHISREFQTPETELYLDSLWETAQRFGAQCTTRQDDLITHVLSNSLRSEEAKWALSTGKFVVKPKWIETSVALYQKANEKDFLPSRYRLEDLVSD